MARNPQRLVVGFSDGPGAAAGLRVLELLVGTQMETHLVMASGAPQMITAETGRSSDEVMALAVRTYRDQNQAAPISSGSFLTVGMIVVACSDVTLTSIAIGYADTLLHRAADVTMKEARPLTILGRELGSSGVGVGGLNSVDLDPLNSLSDVPGLVVRSVSESITRDVNAFDAMILEMLGRFGIATSTVPAEL